MKSTTTNNTGDFFRDDPWELITEPCYPKGRRLYLQDERYWVSMDEEGQILFFVHEKGVGKVKPLENLSGLDISVEALKSGEKRLVCRLKSRDADLRQKFATIAKDIAFNCADYSGTQLFTKTQERIKSWANFLRPSRTGLTREEFIGFLGELYVLSEHMIKLLPVESAIKAWIGPEGKKQDFTFNDWAAEIKTSLSGDQQTVRISSLDQLDPITDRLYLIRVVASPADEESGYSLEELYSQCWDAVGHDIATESLFLRKASLLYDKASNSQIKDRYQIVDLTIYHVDDGFPKLTRSNVDVGIAEAQYQLSISAIAGFEVLDGFDGLFENE